MLDSFNNTLNNDTENLYQYFYLIIIFIFIIIFCLLLIVDNTNIQNSDIITYILISVFVIAVIYYLIAYQNILYKMSYYYYAIQYQLNDVYNTDINYYNLLFNLMFIFISSIITIIIYWDNVYKNSVKISNCNSIIKVIEDNSVIKNPYIYSIIIVNINKIDSSLNNYVIKITYDFKNKNTEFYYGSDYGYENNIFNSMAEKHSNIERKIKEIEENIRNENDMDILDKLGYQLKIMKESDVYKSYLLNKEKRKDDLTKFYYFNLNNMKPSYKEGVNVKALNNINEYKYFCVNESGNAIKTHTAKLLIDFTKLYASNVDHSTSLMYNILFAYKNKDKISL